MTNPVPGTRYQVVYIGLTGLQHSVRVTVVIWYVPPPYTVRIIVVPYTSAVTLSHFVSIKWYSSTCRYCIAAHLHSSNIEVGDRSRDSVSSCIRNSSRLGPVVVDCLAFFVWLSFSASRTAAVDIKSIYLSHLFAPSGHPPLLVAYSWCLTGSGYISSAFWFFFAIRSIFRTVVLFVLILTM